MRPPSYYASLSSNSNSNYSYGATGSSYNPPSSHHHLNRSSSSHQLRSSFSSPSSASYVTRSHLPFVPQSMLVAHCFTGVSSSTKPNYGHHKSSSSLLSPSSYNSSSSSSTGCPSTYSTSYSRPKSLKRYQPVTTASGSVGSSYLSSVTTAAASAAKPYSSTRHIHSNYLTSGGASAGTSSYKRPPTSSYYPKPIRLRERPLLTQISRQLNTTSIAYKPPLTATRAANESIHSKSGSNNSNDTNGAISKVESSVISPSDRQEKEVEENWSTDVARNISRNKYLIKFREFEKRPSGGPIQLTNSLEPSKNIPSTIDLSSPGCPLESCQDHTTVAKHAPEPLSVPEVVRVEEKGQPARRPEEKRTQNHEVSDPSPMKVPLDKFQRSELGPQPSPSDDEKPAKVVTKTTKAAKVELTPSNGFIRDDNANQHQNQDQTKSPKPEEPAAKIDGVALKEKRNIKLKIRTMAPQVASGGAEPKVKVEEAEKPKVKVEEADTPKSKASPVINKSEPSESRKPETTPSSANSSDNNTQACKPKVKRLVKTSSKTAIKTSQPASPEVIVANSAEKPPKSSPKKTIQNNGLPVAVHTNDGSENKTTTKPTKQAATGKAKGERRKSAPKLEPDNDGSGGERQKKVFAPSKQQEQNIEIKRQPEAAVKQQHQPISEPVKRPEIARPEGTMATAMAASAQENKRIRFRDYHLEDFNFLSVLGHGGWGFVILAELKEHDACFAVKCIKKITIVEDDDFDSIMIERKVLTLGNVHPFICKLFCTFETEGYLFFVMEYCPGGDLMFHVQKDGKFTESRCRFYAAEIICAIRFLHNRHIIYRDLKLDNILLDSRGHIRLVDFGMCQCRTYREEMLPSNFCGTPEYISPEIIKGVPYNHSVDWWSFGVLLYEMAVGKMPFRGNDENELLWNVCYEQIHYPMFLTKELTLLLQSLLEREPTKRMGMATCKAGDIYEQAWFRGVDWAAMEEMRVPPPFIPEVNSKRDVQNFDADFTESKPELSPIDDGTLQRIDQTQFQKFPYTNPDIFIFDSLC